MGKQKQEGALVRSCMRCNRRFGGEPSYITVQPVTGILTYILCGECRVQLDAFLGSPAPAPVGPVGLPRPTP